MSSWSAWWLWIWSRVSDPVSYWLIFLSQLIHRFISKLRDGCVSVNDEDWPSFLYEDGIYDPETIDEGLFRGYFLLRVSVWFCCGLFLILLAIIGMAAYVHRSCIGAQEDTRPRIRQEVQCTNTRDDSRYAEKYRICSRSSMNYSWMRAVIADCV